jgi:SOS-response transcriptional repressor LexA
MRTQNIENYKKLLNFIALYKAQNGGNSPSVREIGDAMGHKTTSHTSYMLNRMKEDGVIRKNHGTRSIIIEGNYGL